MTERLNLPTLRVDTSEQRSLRYGRREMTGYKGDTVATALFANGVWVYSRSLKYHRPRGLYSLDGESGNCLMEINGLANTNAETELLRDGDRVACQYVLGTPEYDLYGLLDRFGWLMPAGFYYRRFHKPYRFWPFFLNRIRAMAGAGRLREDWSPGSTRELFLNAEVCVIGGGPAGICAALEASARGGRVVLFEARPVLGGFYDWRPGFGQGEAPLYERAQSLAREAEDRDNIRIFTGSPVTGVWGDNLVTAVQTGGDTDDFGRQYIEVRAGSVVVATGCIERPLIFENNDRPGVMQVGCAWRLARTYGLRPGRKAVLAVADDLGLEAAADLADLGLDIGAVADARETGRDPALVQALADRNLPFLPGWTALTVTGSKQISGVVLTRLDGRQQARFDCDVLAASAGQTPVTGPLTVAGAELAHDARTNFFLPKAMPPRMHGAGRMLGLIDPRAIEASGRRAGLAAAAEQGWEVKAALKALDEELAVLPGPAQGCRLATAPLLSGGKKAFVCFDEDATVKHLQQSCQDGFDRPELAKRYSAAGTGPSQGGIPGHNLPLVLSELREDGDRDLQPTTVRPPLRPVLLDTLAGPGHRIIKRTALHETQAVQGAVFRSVGVWQRARYFSSDFSSRAEIEAVRNRVGLIDVSTLGKFRIFGPDAARALDRVYIGDMAAVPRGRVKYSAMLNDDGCLMDDGVVTRINDNDYYFTTSTGRAGQTSEWIRYHTKDEGWDFHMVNLTDAYAAINLAGPQAREVLGKVTDADISNEAFPYLGYREMTLAGTISARVMRLGFVGELSYEMHVPASLALVLWQAILEAGVAYGIRPFGLEAQNVLRLEKGHVIIGQESEIRTTLHDLGLGWLWARDKAGARKVGAPALRFTESQTGRLKLVGIRLDNQASPPPGGSLIVEEGIQGHLCTVRSSQTLNQTIGLALVRDHLTAPGTNLKVFAGRDHEPEGQATVVETPFYDPAGERLRS
jgi:sarcosine oxidase subunit alpha